jgi:hypothetical protein
MLADRYTDDAERGKAMGIAITGYALGMIGYFIEDIKISINIQ